MVQHSQQRGEGPPTIQVICLTEGDTVYSAREALAQANAGGQVWMTLPSGLQWAHNIVNLKLLKRCAEAADIELHVVSRHSQVRLLARDAGLFAHMRLPARLRQYTIQRPQKAVRQAQRVVSTNETVEPDWERRPQSLSLGTVLISIGILVTLVAALFASVAAFVPTATVTLRPVAQEHSGIIEVIADPRYEAIDYDARTIPARSVQAIVSGRGQVSATGSADIPGGHASGEVIFANRTDTPVVVPKGTVVRTSVGIPVRFITVSDVEVPARLYGSARVGVIAEQPGPSGNVRALAINVVEGAVAPYVDVLNDAPTTGGSANSVPVVTAEDLERVRLETMQKLGEEAYAQIMPQLRPREFVPEDSLEVLIMSQEFEQVVGQRSDIASVQMKVVARGLALDSAVIEELASAYLEELAGSTDNLAVIPDSLLVARSPGKRGDDNTYIMSISAQGMVAPLIDVEEVKRELVGKTAGQAEKWLAANLPLAEEPRLEIWPRWWPFVPWLSGRVNVRIAAEIE